MQNIDIAHQHSSSCLWRDTKTQLELCQDPTMFWRRSLGAQGQHSHLSDVQGMTPPSLLACRKTTLSGFKVSAAPHREVSAIPGLGGCSCADTGFPQPGDLHPLSPARHSLCSIKHQCPVWEQLRQRGEKGAAASSHDFSPGCLPGAHRAPQGTGSPACICLPLL